MIDSLAVAHHAGYAPPSEALMRAEGFEDLSR